MALDEDVTCSITHNDIPPTLTVKKTIVNNDGGAATDPDAFNLQVDGITVLDALRTSEQLVDNKVVEEALQRVQRQIGEGRAGIAGMAV